jgi:hypothetical protein
MDILFIYAYAYALIGIHLPVPFQIAIFPWNPFQQFVDPHPTAPAHPVSFIYNIIVSLNESHYPFLTMSCRQVVRLQSPKACKNRVQTDSTRADQSERKSQNAFFPVLLRMFIPREHACPNFCRQAEPLL